MNFTLVSALSQNFEAYHGHNQGKEDGFAGSPYLQAKITNAKEALLKLDLEENGPPPGGDAGDKPAGGDENATADKK